MLLVLVPLVLAVLTLPAHAQTGPIQTVLQDNREDVERASRRTVGPIVDAIIATGSDRAPLFLERWSERVVYQRETDGLFFLVEDEDADPMALIDIDTGAPAGEAPEDDMDQLRPNSGVRGVIAAALVRFQLSDPDPDRRAAGLQAIERDPDASHLAALRAAIDNEPDVALKARKQRLERLLTVTFGADEAARVAAIESFAGDISVDVRATLNPLLSTRTRFAEVLPADANVARTLEPGSDIAIEDAYAMLADAGRVPETVDDDARDAALVANIADGRVGGVSVASLDTDQAREDAYAALAATGSVPPRPSAEDRAAAVADHVFFETYNEPSRAVTDAARATLQSIESRVAAYGWLDLGLDGLSLASIYFLAAIGLAITFGVMGVINMAHGEFIMIGAYTGYVVQQFVPDHTASIILALPLAFLLAFAAGVALERLVIRHLMHRPLETLLATFGISIALQQLAKNIFGTQARPLTAPGWLDGALTFNDVVSISYIRIAIFVLALVFFVLLWFILNRTRLGLEVRAVTQNSRMAASMGISPDRVNMLTFGLGSGIAGIAGVAIGLYAQVTSELGASYIVQSFMTVVVGGVGNIWGTLAGAGMIGSLQKLIEWFNPANTLAAQTYMIIFIIIFIQFRPKGIFALRGRAAGD
ncbi:MULTISPECIES: urea ABC transporter permease subunit UrtB [unclassified Roseitalea]|uniref:urea ABC transporter permease subunit UrtB n=1 Tax=unclassified Roseitalea TaxID=2639107 RepID=UPI00273F9B30|nr:MULTISPECIES: urea ABC transporter permease subunit UrtB [unclassified Roseitalea]